jgi:hypothetical protein
MLDGPATGEWEWLLGTGREDEAGSMLDSQPDRRRGRLSALALFGDGGA